MNFQIHGLPGARFEDLFALSDAELDQRGIKRMTAPDHPGYPCRVSLAEAKVGDTLLLMNYEHQPEASPYRSRHAIFVREGAKDARPDVGEVPEVIRSRLISVRMFDDRHMIIDADVMEGTAVAQALDAAFQDEKVSYVHLHNAKQGCFAASATRA